MVTGSKGHVFLHLSESMHTLRHGVFYVLFVDWLCLQIRFRQFRLENRMEFSLEEQRTDDG
jgi:hypothetical protein